jgi:hypothetical protein
MGETPERAAPGRSLAGHRFTPESSQRLGGIQRDFRPFQKRRGHSGIGQHIRLPVPAAFA